MPSIYCRSSAHTFGSFDCLLTIPLFTSMAGDSFSFLIILHYSDPTQASAPPSSSCILTMGILPYSVALSLSFSAFPFEGPYIIKVEDEGDEIAVSQHSDFCFGLLMALSSLGLESAMVGGVWMLLAWP